MTFIRIGVFALGVVLFVLALPFALPGSYFVIQSTGEVLVEPRESDASMTWIAEGDLGLNPVMRWFGLVCDRMIGRAFEGGLAGLKNMGEFVEP